MDPNDCIYPIAFVVVEAYLQIDNTFTWTTMIDKRKVL
jgi:hypothetical protein